MTDDERKAMTDAVWTGDTDILNTRWPCRCCCHEHTFGSGCPAYAWGGCRGQGAEENDYEGWVRHYERFHGMPRAVFDGVEA